jgi:large subunit ribosomal protein L18
MRKSILNTKLERRQRVKRGIRSRVFGEGERPRLTVFRSNSAIYCQIVDDVKGVTIVSFSSRTKEVLNETKPKQEKSFIVGQKLAEKAIAAGVSKVVFDRNGYKYHGRIKALAEGARQAGLQF